MLLSTCTWLPQIKCRRRLQARHAGLLSRKYLRDGETHCWKELIIINNTFYKRNTLNIMTFSPLVSGFPLLCFTTPDWPARSAITLMQIFHDSSHQEMTCANKQDSFKHHHHHHHHQCSAQGQVLHCKLRHQVWNSAQRQVFYCKLRNLGCSFTRDE